MGWGKNQKTRGFTLVEVMVSMALGLVVLAAALQLYKQGVDTTFVVSQRAEMQQDSRAAMGLVSKDISMAGANLPKGGIQLPGGAQSSIYGCDQTQCYVPGLTPTGIAYPTGNVLYGIIPGYQQGMPTSSGGPPTDTITVVYVDPTFALNQYSVTALTTSSITFGATPAGVPPIGDPAVGIKVGDLLLVQNNVGAAIGEVTGIAGSVITFGDLDALHINQSAAPTSPMKALAQAPVNLAATSAQRILVITYYIDVPKGPDGIRYTADDLPPRLMRQINGQTPSPVAENINGLQFTYDSYDDTTNTPLIGSPNAGMPGNSPNQIREVNIVHLTSRGSLKGTKGFQGLDLTTSVSVRNMSFMDRYK